MFVTLFHGTTKENAELLLAHGWEPNKVSPGANQGQSQYLYLTNHPENARWFSEQKGENTILVLEDVPIEYLLVDPEDGVYDTVDDELKTLSRSGIPGCVVLAKPLPAKYFKPFNF